MHILSLSDIQLIVDMFETQQPLSNVEGRERQVDNLIRMGYLRPLRATYMLTELGDKTARSLQMRHFVPTRELPPAAVTAETTTDTAAVAPALEEA